MGIQEGSFETNFLCPKELTEFCFLSGNFCCRFVVVQIFPDITTVLIGATKSECDGIPLRFGWSGSKQPLCR